MAQKSNSVITYDKVPALVQDQTLMMCKVVKHVVKMMENVESTKYF